MEPVFDYDVAFSFLAKDENIAFQLNDALNGSLKTFLYSEQQKRLAGTDGEVTFASVFGQKSRSVVILYRQDWGTTPWTRIEETSIRNRAYESGYDFALLMPLEKPPTKPTWFPQNRLWIGFERWGIKGAAAVIEARVQELGGTPHRETLEERAARHERETRFNQEREAALNSYEGVVAFHQAIERTRVAIRDGVKRINNGRELHRLTYECMPQPSGPCAVTGLHHALMVQGRARYSNTLEGASSEATIWKNGLPWPGTMSFDEPQKYRTLKFDLDYLPTQAYALRTLDQDGAFTPEELAEEILKWYLDNGGDPA
jgi:hypothetical protein